jgi:hypothetical protein
MMTFLTGVGLAALATGAFVIARSRLVRADEDSDIAAGLARFARQDDQGMATRFGVVMIALGTALALLDLAGIVLSAATAGIVFILVVGFLVAHHNYAKDRRAARHADAAAPNAQHQ